MTLYSHLREGVIVVDGVDVHYYDSEFGDDSPPVVLLHGTGGPAEKNFWAVFPMLAFTRRVITFDFGLPDERLTLEHYVRQAQAVIRELSPGHPVALVGYSLGAVVAAAVAARSAELVDRLVLVAGWMKTDRHQLLRNTIWQHLTDEGSSAIGSFGVFANYSAQHLSSRTPGDFTEILERAERTRYSPQVMALNRTIDITADVAAIAVPTLVIGCTFDQMVQVRHSRELFGAIVDARYAEIASGHAVVHERPAELFVRIDTFVSHPTEFTAGTVLSTESA